jgi:hypothetical protein
LIAEVCEIEDFKFVLNFFPSDAWGQTLAVNDLNCNSKFFVVASFENSRLDNFVLDAGF